MSLAAAVAESVAELDDVLDTDTRFDCVVSWYDLADGTGADVLDRVAKRRPETPVFLLVDAADGRVPVEAVSRGFAACVPVDAGESPIGRLRDVIGAAPDDSSGTSAHSPPTGWSEESWKATLLDQLFERLPLHLYIKDRDARIVHVTEGPVSERIHPYGEQFRGKRDIDGVVPLAEAIDSYVDDLQVLGLGESIVDKEEHFPSSNRWFLTTKVPLHDDTGGIVGLIGVAREITERKERDRQLTALTHLVRHNLRNEVNVIGGWAETLSQSVEDPARPQANRIVDATDKLLSTIDKQQDVIDVLATRADPVTVDATAVVHRIVEETRERYPAGGIDCTLPDHARIGVVEGFGRAMAELVDNAVAHNPRDAPFVEVTVEPCGETVRIRVADDGPTIPEMEVEVLTGERSIEPLYHGTGLGLWLVNWTVRRSDGTLRFDPNQPHGNVVTVTVPAAERDR